VQGSFIIGGIEEGGLNREGVNNRREY